MAFYNKLPVDRDKEKIDALVQNSTDVIRKMKIEYDFKKFFTKYPIIDAFVIETELWAKLAFYTAIILNILNLYSFTDRFKGHLNEPRFYHRWTPEATKLLFDIFGILLIFFTFLIDLTTISKRVLYHYQ